MSNVIKKRSIQLIVFFCSGFFLSNVLGYCVPSWIYEDPRDLKVGNMSQDVLRHFQLVAAFEPIVQYVMGLSKKEREKLFLNMDEILQEQLTKSFTSSSLNILLKSRDSFHIFLTMWRKIASYSKGLRPGDKTFLLEFGKLLSCISVHLFRGMIWNEDTDMLYGKIFSMQDIDEVCAFLFPVVAFSSMQESERSKNAIFQKEIFIKKKEKTMASPGALSYRFYIIQRLKNSLTLLEYLHKEQRKIFIHKSDEPSPFYSQEVEAIFHIMKKTHSLEPFFQLEGIFKSFYLLNDINFTRDFVLLTFFIFEDITDSSSLHINKKRDFDEFKIEEFLDHIELHEKNIPLQKNAHSLWSLESIQKICSLAGLGVFVCTVLL